MVLIPHALSPPTGLDRMMCSGYIAPTKQKCRNDLDCEVQTPASCVSLDQVEAEPTADEPTAQLEKDAALPSANPYAFGKT